MYVEDVIVNMSQAKNKEKRLRAPCKFTVENQEILFENGQDKEMWSKHSVAFLRLIVPNFFALISVLDGFFDTNSKG